MRARRSATLHCPVSLLVVAITEVVAPAHMHAKGFVEDNKDEMSPLLTELLEVDTGFKQLKKQANTFKSKMALDEEERKQALKAKADGDKSKGNRNKGAGATRAKKTVSRAFGDSLNTLMSKLEETDHRYIRCLKPNHVLKAGKWDEELMKRQLSYSGTLEVCKVRKAGLNTRMPLSQFFPWYKIISAKPKMLRG